MITRPERGETRLHRVDTLHAGCGCARMRPEVRLIIQKVPEGVFRSVLTTSISPKVFLQVEKNRSTQSLLLLQSTSSHCMTVWELLG